MNPGESRWSRSLRGLTTLRRLPRMQGSFDEQWERLLPPAILVGLLAGLAAVVLRSSVHELFELLHGARESSFGFLLPALGAALGVAIVTMLFREQDGHGVPEVIRSVCREGGRLPKRSIFSRFLGSLVNVSSGGSAGLEGPIVFSSAALGSSFGTAMKVDDRRRTVFLACGVAGGISAIFNAPMTGLIFATEVVLAEWSAFAIVPIAISSVAATALSRVLLGNQQSFLHASFDMGTDDLLACAALGALAGVTSVVLVRASDLVHKFAARLRKRPLLAPALFGLGVGAIGLIAPEAIGEGYDTVQRAINSELAGPAVCLGLLAAKIAASAMTLGSGAPGGIFAPCLVVGSLLGASFVGLANSVLPGPSPLADEGSYALVGMCGLLAGVLQAPLSGIFLVMEVTGGYEVILPLMIVSVLSLVVSRFFSRYSVYERELAQRGDLLRAGTDQRILADVRVSEALDELVTPVREDMSLADMTEVLKRSRRNDFPVLKPAEEGAPEEYVGMLHLGDVRELLFDPLLAQVTLVGTTMDTSLPRVPSAATLADALVLFEQSGAWVLPVVDGERFVGLLSKSTLFDHYRRELAVQRPQAEV